MHVCMYARTIRHSRFRTRLRPCIHACIHVCPHNQTLTFSNAPAPLHTCAQVRTIRRSRFRKRPCVSALTHRRSRCRTRPQTCICACQPAQSDTHAFERACALAYMHVSPHNQALPLSKAAYTACQPASDAHDSHSFECACTPAHMHVSPHKQTLARLQSRTNLYAPCSSAQTSIHSRSRVHLRARLPAGLVKAGHSRQGTHHGKARGRACAIQLRHILVGPAAPKGESE